MKDEEGRFGAATDEQIALADSIADRMYPRTHPGWIGGQACALRAIQMTTELAAKLVGDVIFDARTGEIDNDLRCIGHIMESRLRTNDHLKGHPQ